MNVFSYIKYYIRHILHKVSYKKKNPRIDQTDLNASVHRSSHRQVASGETAERRVKRCQLRYLTTCTDGESWLLTRVKGRGLDRGNDFMSCIGHRA